ncbi:unnamed protein product [Spirodela intermedia]|uniref:Uncharacterized protein n=1 Tax=Spirodela intermedia TaxID=51605 RepID=A0A7I8L1S1_SPIIN|nr:unnamed protein product [Spirodela intermedia]
MEGLHPEHRAVVPRFRWSSSVSSSIPSDEYQATSPAGVGLQAGRECARRGNDDVDGVRRQLAGWLGDES